MKRLLALLVLVPLGCSKSEPSGLGTPQTVEGVRGAVDLVRYLTQQGVGVKAEPNVELTTPERPVWTLTGDGGATAVVYFCPDTGEAEKTLRELEATGACGGFVRHRFTVTFRRNSDPDKKFADRLRDVMK